ncbi:hypothetical protein BGZ95_007814 [Linnemannia exigua]|uniref:Uncharacterized protein n=1 Tax=Linnemannia exigua TaxID=604196 RepID=A0AAD4H827_9FUNG|nr:hypothetical protein BGZ95_007814 [Linnemannia exigua]
MEILDLHAHEMDMDEVEMGDWICRDLKEIRLRVKGLNIKDNILKAIVLWRKGCWRRWREQAGTPVAEEEGRLDETDMSIVALIACHLLKFDTLWTAWLGYQTWILI